jgi:hypothetical protein
MGTSYFCAYGAMILQVFSHRIYSRDGPWHQASDGSLQPENFGATAQQLYIFED